MHNVSLDDLRCRHNVLQIRMSNYYYMYTVHVLSIAGRAFEINPTMCFRSNYVYIYMYVHNFM